MWNSCTDLSSTLAHGNNKTKIREQTEEESKQKRVKMEINFSFPMPNYSSGLLSPTVAAMNYITNLTPNQKFIHYLQGGKPRIINIGQV